MMNSDGKAKAVSYLKNHRSQKSLEIPAFRREFQKDLLDCSKSLVKVDTREASLCERSMLSTSNVMFQN